MTHLVVNRLNPHPLAVVNPPPLPVLRMHQVDLAVLVSLAGGLSPIDVLVPFNLRSAHVVKAAEVGNRPVERAGAMVAKKPFQISVDSPAVRRRRDDHSHRETASIR